MLTQPAPFARQKYCCSVDGMTVRAHSRSQNVLNSWSRASFWLGHAQAAPGSTGAGCSSTRAGGATGAGAGSSSSLREAERVLVDVLVDVDDFDEELEVEDAVVVSDALVCVVVGVGATVVLVYGKSSSGSASRTSSSLAQPASSAAAITAALQAGTARLLLTARVSFRSAAGTLSKSPLG